MSRFFVSSRTNPCPICSDVSGDCRSKDELILCHSFIEQDSGIAGYKFAKTSSSGVWGVHVPDNGKEFDREQYEQYLAQKRQKENNRKQFYADNALDANSRDKAIRKLAQYIGLDSRCRDDLRRRGLSDRQIEQGLFFSIDPWKKFDLDLPRNLPGIHWKGDRFATKDSGYACVIFDSQGRAISWQLRVEGVTKGNKYKWAINSKLRNSENPITFIPSENSSKRLYVTEGTLKPYIAANRLNLSVCGASGGYFAGSSKQFAEIQSEFDEFAIAPDAGDIVNLQVMQRWEKQITFLRSFEKPIKVAWWGQIDKNQNRDVDEIYLTTLSKAEFLTPLEFFDLAKKEQYKKQQWIQWKDNKKFTPQITVDMPYIRYNLPPKNVIAFIKSGLGSGKTTQLIEHLKQLDGQGILNIGYRNTLLLQFNEKTKEFEVHFYHLQSDKKLREFNLEDSAINVSCCVDSLPYFVKEHFDGKTIILDEIISILKHLLFSPTIKRFNQVKELFSEMVNRADRVICLDGNMQDWAVDFFKGICPQKEIITIENTYKGNTPQVKLLNGTIDSDKKFKKNDRTPWLKLLLESQCPAMASDSQIFCESIENLYLEQGRNGIRIDSKTVSEPHVKEFLENPDKWIEENKPEYLIHSPSFESGGDISIKNYFDKHFSFFFGAIDTDSCYQMIARVRDTTVTRYAWVKEFVRSEDGKKRPTNVQDLQSDRLRNLMHEVNILNFDLETLSKNDIASRLQKLYQDALDPYSDTADKIQVIQNFEFTNYRECLKRQMIGNGYKVESVTMMSLLDKEDLANQESESKEEVRQQNANDIYNASDKYVGQSNVNLNFDANWQDRCAVFKAKLLDDLPDIEYTDTWKPELIHRIKYKEPSLIRQLENYHLLNNLNQARELSLRKYNRIFHSGYIKPWKLRQDYLRLKLLNDLGINNFIKEAIANNTHFTQDSPQVAAMLKTLNRKKYRDIFGLPSKKHPMKTFNNILRSLGLKVKSQIERDEHGDCQRNYQIDIDDFNSDIKKAILDSLKLKYDKIINSTNEPLDWSLNTEKQAEKQHFKNSTEKTAKTVARHSIDTVTHDPIFINKYSNKCNNHNELSFIGNNTMENNTTNIIQNPLDSDEAIADLAGYLMLVDSAEYLRELQRVPEVTKARLRKASHLLPQDKYNQIMRFAIANRKKTA